MSVNCTKANTDMTVAQQPDGKQSTAGHDPHVCRQLALYRRACGLLVHTAVTRQLASSMRISSTVSQARHGTQPKSICCPLRHHSTLAVYSLTQLCLTLVVCAACAVCVLPSAALMSSVYEDHKDEDGFLYITYSGENTFGSSGSSSDSSSMDLLQLEHLQQ